MGRRHSVRMWLWLRVADAFGAAGQLFDRAFYWALKHAARHEDWGPPSGAAVNEPEAPF